MEEESKSLSDLPENWSLSTIGEITTPVEKIDAHTDPDRQITYLDISGIDNKANRIGDTKTFRLADAPSRARQIVKSGDVLFSTVRPYLRNIAQVRAEFDGEIASTGFSVLRPAPGVEPIFLFFKAISKLFVDTISGEQYGASYPAVKDAQVRAQPVAVPPTKEQQRIVEKIDTLFARLDKGEEAVRDVQKLLTRYRQSVLKSAVTGQLTADWRAERKGQLKHGRDLLARILETGRESWDGRGKYKAPDAPDTAELPDLPTGWVWASVDQLARIMGGLTKNSKRKEMSMTRPMLRVANVYQNRLELDDIHETGITEGELARVSLQARDILVVEGNGSKSQIGRMAVWSDEIPNAVHQNHLIKVRLYETALAEFMVAWFQSPIGRQVVEKVASSTSGLYTLSISKIAAMVAPLPSLEEVDEIVRGVEEAHSKIAVLEEWCETELKRSASLRQSILKDAFAGKLVPQDPTDEPASTFLARIAAEKPTAKKTRRKTTA